MSENTIKWRDVIGISLMSLGLLFIFILSYFGYIYLSEGNNVLSIVIATIAMLIFLLLVMALAAQKSRDRNHGFTFMEGLLLFLYALFAVFAFALMAHFINLELVLKEKIQTLGRDKIRELQNIVEDYKDKVADTKTNIETDVAGLVSEYRATKNFATLQRELATRYKIDLRRDGNEIEQINTAIASKLEEQEKRALDSKYVDIETEINEVTQKASSDLNNWNRPSLHAAFSELDSQISKSGKQLKEAFKAPTSEGNYYWNKYSFEPQPPSPKAEALISDPLELQRRYSPSLALPIVVALVLHLLILMPYFLTQRQGMRVFYRKGKLRKPTGGIEV